MGAIDVRDGAGAEVRALLVQPKRLALFAYLALRGSERLTRRDVLLALFWPEATDDAARHSLRQALHGIRHALGDDVIARRGRDEIGLAPGRVWCDATEFERAAAARRGEDALALYGGPLLEGFHVAGVAPELDRWLDAERARLRGLALHCAGTLTDEAERAGNLALAARSARDASRLAPFDEAAVRRLMALLHATGDRAGALRAYEALAARLTAELETAPSAETRALADGIRRESVRSEGTTRVAMVMTAHGGDAIMGEGGGAPLGTGSDAPPRAMRRHRLRHRLRALAAVALLAMLATVAAVATVVALVATRRPPHPAAPPVLAVGTLRVRTGDTSLSPRLVRELLATDLARLQGLGVVSAERIDELLARHGAAGDTVSVAGVALRAGATEVVEGILSDGAGHALRLDVRLVDPARGIIRDAHVAEGPDVFALADTVTAWIAARVRHSAPAAPLRAVTSTSLVARRFYDEGLRALNQGDTTAALRLFRAALAEDSTFGMAAHYAGIAAWNTLGDAEALPLMARALRLSRRGSERERLFAATAWASMTNDPSWVAVAESLATRYPLEPDGELWLGQALVWAGDRGRAIPHLRRVVAHDSAMLDAAPDDTARQRLPCRACVALYALVTAYTEGDSLDLAERAARDWTRRQPANPRGWGTLAGVYELAGRGGEALAAQREASRRAGRDLADAAYRARLAIRAGDYVTADRLLTDRLADGDPTVRVDAWWWLAISLREQRRFAEALRVVERAIALDDSTRRAADPASAPRFARAEILLELGRAHEAAAAFDALAAVPGAYLAEPTLVVPGRLARRRAWGLALAATARAAAGDTATLGTLADSVTAIGRRSAFGRDRRLGSYVRGLRYAARHDYPDAEAAFRAAIHSPNLGFTRVNLELARVLLAERRPRAAVPVLEAALRGSLEGSNYYVTRTELEELLARATAAAGADR